MKLKTGKMTGIPTKILNLIEILQLILIINSSKEATNQKVIRVATLLHEPGHHRENLVEFVRKRAWELVFTPNLGVGTVRRLPRKSQTILNLKPKNPLLRIFQKTNFSTTDQD